MSTTKRFEIDDGSSSKFWSIRVDGKSHTVNFGRIGTNGQIKTKAFATAAAANKDAERLIQQKTGKGYEPVTSARPVAPRKNRPPKGIKYRTKNSLGRDSVSDAWDCIEAWLQQHLPDTYRALNPPAKVAQIKSFEKVIGNTLPTPLKESYRRHNGHRSVSAGLLFGLPLLSLEDVIGHWKNWSGYDRSKKTKNNFDDLASCFPSDFVQPVYFTRNWIPVSEDSGGNHIAIDLSPAEKGVFGQVIVCGRDDTFHPVIALDWAQFLSDVATEMERGNWTIETLDPDWGPEFYLAAPASEHFNDVGANWSRCKLGMRTLSSSDEDIWKKHSQT